MSTNTTDTSTTDTKELNWAKHRAALLMKSVGFEGVERTESNDTVRDTIAAALQQVADECAEIAERNDDGWYSAVAIRVKFSTREGA